MNSKRGFFRCLHVVQLSCYVRAVTHALNQAIVQTLFCSVSGIQWQRMESEALRRSYKMQAGQKGADFSATLINVCGAV